jgi:aspartate racemase
MKTIGMLGGMSWESTLEYYRILNQLTQKELGDNHSCPCIIHSFDFQTIQTLQHDNKWDKLSSLLTVASRNLESSGADLLLICTNTMHKVAGNIQDNIEIPLIHIADAVALEIQKKGINKVGLLGTKFTMEEDFYKKKLKKEHHIECIIPSDDERIIVHNVIYKELVMGNFNEESREQFRRIIQNLEKRGAGGIILGCTEIPLLIRQKDCDIPLFDTTTIHAAAAFKHAIK